MQVSFDNSHFSYHKQNEHSKSSSLVPKLLTLVAECPEVTDIRPDPMVVVWKSSLPSDSPAESRPVQILGPSYSM